jgi:hypothetical protein
VGDDKVHNYVSSREQDQVPLGPSTKADDDKQGNDSLLIQTSSVDPAAASIAGTWPVAGVLTAAAVKDLPMGTLVCFDGAMSGVVCGPLTDTADNGQLRFAVTPIGGDSGAPVFLVDHDTKAATLVGILKARITVTKMATATYLDSALARIMTLALVDPHAAAGVAGDARYSKAVTPIA